MPPKRTRRATPPPSGLSAGERLKRTKLTGNAAYSAWGWVDSEVTDASGIREEHRLATCGFSRKNRQSLCANKYVAKPTVSTAVASKAHRLPSPPPESLEDELMDDVIVISDDEGPMCTNKICKYNPYCLNYLGQDKWEDSEEAFEGYSKVHYIGENPLINSRNGRVPIGLKNLGATCYANAYLQVWFQDLPFRKAVFECQPTQDAQRSFEDSPIFQLQVTFAAMQHSTQSSFNPVNLVESLKLRATEQQDAQEFSKLFMAHLDTEFKRQKNPELKSLIADQFQGKQVYNTVCQTCQRRSERDSDFLEIEVNLENNATLEERLSAWLEPELLTGDNQYLCQECDGLQDAKRYTELRELPPVLHFSLLRFVYDVSTMERKKSKQTIMFPTSIDMDAFVGPEETRKQRRKGHAKENKNVYELRGVLLHKGASAYHGHYEAQVFDVCNQGWYQFNDESVTKIESLVPKVEASKKGSKTAKDTKKKQTDPPAKGRPPKKRRRIDSDSEIEIIENPMPPKKGTSASSSSSDGPEYISSRDAYMLVYTRIGHKGSPAPPHQTNGGSSATDSKPPGPVPPPRALEVVNNLNADHKKSCDEYVSREKEERIKFNRIRNTVKDIYRSWSMSSREEEGIVASRQALDKWLSRHIVKPKTPKGTPAPTPNIDNASSSNGEPSHSSISIADVVCQHGRLDPEKANDMKVITKTAYSRIVDEDGCTLEPRLSTADVCPQCVERMFKEKLYQIEHPRLVSQFDEIAAVEDDGDGYHVSKAWLKDWRLAKPKMHVDGAPDPPPDAEDYVRDVVCEHEGLSTNVTARRRIPAEAYLFLRDLFPNWKPPSTSSEPCPVCEALMHISKEDKREYRKQAEEEKARLKHMHDNALNGNTSLLEDVPCAIVPSLWVRSWRQWVLRPSEVPRPGDVDNMPFTCEHGLLTFDPNVVGDVDTSMSIIKRSDWAVLEELYAAGPLIAIEKSADKFVHALDVCSDCRLTRRTSFDMTEITVRVLGPGDPTPTPETYSDELKQPIKNGATVQTTLVTYGKKGNMEGSRKSKRIRQVREHGKRRKFTITKTMTVKDLKVMFNEDLGIPVISQRLFYRGKEVDDSSATMLSLGILSNDLLDLKEESEDLTILTDTDDEGTTTGPAAKRKRMEGQAFGGTLLGSSSGFQSRSSPAPPPNSRPSSAEVATKADAGVACPVCTYENVSGTTACDMCETPLDNAI